MPGLWGHRGFWTVDWRTRPGHLLGVNGDGEVTADLWLRDLQWLLKICAERIKKIKLSCWQKLQQQHSRLPGLEVIKNQPFVMSSRGADSFDSRRPSQAFIQPSETNLFLRKVQQSTSFTSELKPSILVSTLQWKTKNIFIIFGLFWFV